MSTSAKICQTYTKLVHQAETDLVVEEATKMVEIDLAVADAAVTKTVVIDLVAVAAETDMVRDLQCSKVEEVEEDSKEIKMPLSLSVTLTTLWTKELSLKCSHLKD